MASLSTSKKSGTVRLFVAVDGERRAIHLGRIGEHDAETFRRYASWLEAAHKLGEAPDPDTLLWLDRLSDHFHEKFSRLGLAKPRAAAGRATLGAFTQAYIDGRADAKPRTIDNLTHARRRLIGFFGEDRDLSSITPADADEWYQWLVGVKKYAPATIGRTVRRARQFYTAAMRRGLVQSNPFSDVKAPATTNRDRDYYVTPETAQRVIDACPDAQWRLIVALSRFGGLRCPSEVLALTWQDVNWERERVKIRSCKTEHHAGGGSRIIPLFPELRPHLEAAFDEAKPGAVHCVTRYRDSRTNLRTQLLRTIDKAGVDDWPKPFHNMRASRETELAQRFPLHVVCSWLGNSTTIAAKHYLQTTEEHFEQATGKRTDELAAKTTHNPTRADIVSGGPGSSADHETPLFTPPDDPVPFCTNVQAPCSKRNPNRSLSPVNASLCSSIG